MFGKEDAEYVKEKERILVEKERIRLVREDLQKKLATERANPEWHEQVSTSSLSRFVCPKSHITSSNKSF